MALASEGLRPEIVLIEQAGSDWAAREGHWIAHYRAAGANLNNHSDGGEGAPGVRASTKAIANRAARMKALWTDPDFRERQRQRLVERNRNGPRPRWTEERRNAIREGNARRWTPEARKENGVRTAARNKTMKVKWTDERRAKQSEVAQRVNADPARKAKQSALMTRLNRERRRST